MNNRIRAIRKHFGVSQTVFGSKIGVSLGVIKNLEQGKTQLTSPLFELFCSTYNVNPDWLLTGVGEMFLPEQESSLDSLITEYNLSPKAGHVLKNFFSLSTEEQDSFIEQAQKIFCSND